MKCSQHEQGYVIYTSDLKGAWCPHCGAYMEEVDEGWIFPQVAELIEENIKYYSGGEELKSFNESLGDERIVEVLRRILQGEKPNG